MLKSEIDSNFYGRCQDVARRLRFRSQRGDFLRVAGAAMRMTGGCCHTHERSGNVCSFAIQKKVNFACQQNDLVRNRQFRLVFKALRRNRNITSIRIFEGTNVPKIGRIQLIRSRS